MITAFYTAASGVTSMQQAMDVVANNTANVSTDGFRRGQATFSDLLYTNMHASEEDTRLKEGHGTKLNTVNYIHVPSAIRRTERQLDFAIPEDGFFAIETGDEQIKYTRAGGFNISVEEDGLYVVNHEGGYLLDEDGDRVMVESIDSEIEIAVWQFPNNDGLLIEGGLYFNETEESGVPEVIEGAEAIRGSLEASNVDLAQTMVDMIQYQRAFQFNSKLLQSADEIMQTINSLR